MTGCCCKCFVSLRWDCSLRTDVSSWWLTRNLTHPADGEQDGCREKIMMLFQVEVVSPFTAFTSLSFQNKSSKTPPYVVKICIVQELWHKSKGWEKKCENSAIIPDKHADRHFKLHWTQNLAYAMLKIRILTGRWLLSPFQRRLHISATTTRSPLTCAGQICHLRSVISSTDERMAFRFAAGAARNGIRLRFSSAARLLLPPAHTHTHTVETPADGCDWSTQLPGVIKSHLTPSELTCAVLMC